MFDYLKGKLIEAAPPKVVIEIQGMGYSIFAPLNTFSKLPQVGEMTHLYISEVIREDSHKLFGFITKTDRDLFEKVTGVSGIGPKTALALIGHLDASDLQIAITGANIKLLSKIPGIGKKTAERLIIEMRDKVNKLDITPLSTNPTHHSLANDALNALTNLGYKPLEAQKAVKKALSECDDEVNLSTLITTTLKQI